jgi:hypothetical protein
MQLAAFAIKRFVRKDQTSPVLVGCDLPHLTFQWAGVILSLRGYYLHV